MHAIVQQIYPEGKHGPYAVAVPRERSEAKGSLTFSLSPPVWTESAFPEHGSMVVLSQIRRKSLGLRALSARFFGSQDDSTANSGPKKIELPDSVIKLVAPLHQYWNSQTPWGTIGGSFSDSDPAVTHADYILQKVIPQLAGACEQFGMENVVRDLVEMALPVYLKADHARSQRGQETYVMGAFWGSTIGGRQEETLLHQTNAKLAAVFGVRAVYGPILSLAEVHAEARVFSPSKFFHTHACRMGHILTRFGEQGLITYTELCKKLLNGKLYDWSLEFPQDAWLHLEPCIREFGMKPVLEPMVDAMLMLADIPGTKDGKYKYSFFSLAIQDLMPFIASRVMASGPKEIRTTLSPLVKFVLTLHGQGAFREEGFRGAEREFFQAFKELLPTIQRVGIKPTLDGIRAEWKAKLIRSE